MQQVTRETLQNYVGKASKPSEWLTVKQEQIDQFADCTLDHQFIHVNPEEAAKTAFGSTIAHGFLSLSMLSYFAESFGTVIDGVYMGVNYGFDKVRFISPVKVESKIRATATLVAAEEKKPGQFMLTTDVTVEIEGSDKPALKAQWITMQMVK